MIKHQQLLKIEYEINKYSKALHDLITKAWQKPNSFEGKHRKLLAKKYQRQLNEARLRRIKLTQSN